MEDCAATCIRGVCENGECVCDFLYTGSNCDEPFKEVSGWEVAFHAYTAITLLVYVIFLILSAYQFVLVFLNARKTKRRTWTIVTYIHIGLWISLLGRIIWFAADPHGMYAIFPSWVNSVLYTGPNIIWLDLWLMMMLYWIELAQRTKVSELYFVKEFKPLLFTLMAVPLLLMLPIRIWYDVTLSPIAQYAFSGIFSLLLFIVLGVYGVVGMRMRRLVRSIWKTTKQTHFKAYLKKLTIALLASVVFISGSALLLIPYAFIGNSPWIFLAFQSGFRFFEGLCLLSFLVAIHKQKSDEKNDSSSRMKSADLSDIRVSSEDVPTPAMNKSSDSLLSSMMRPSQEAVVETPSAASFKISGVSTDGNESTQSIEVPNAV